MPRSISEMLKSLEACHSSSEAPCNEIVEKLGWYRNVDRTWSLYYRDNKGAIKQMTRLISTVSPVDYMALVQEAYDAIY